MNRFHRIRPAGQLEGPNPLLPTTPVGATNPPPRSGPGFVVGQQIPNSPAMGAPSYAANPSTPAATSAVSSAPLPSQNPYAFSSAVPSAPIGTPGYQPVGSAPVGSAPFGSAPSSPIGSTPVGSAPVSSAPVATSPGVSFGGVTRVSVPNLPNIPGPTVGTLVPPLGTATVVPGAFAVPGIATPVSGPFFAPEAPTGDESIPWWLIALMVGGAIGIVYSTKGGPRANPSDSELREMQKLLKDQGFNPNDAKKLLKEGMGPFELAHRLKVKPGLVGSLEYTHNMRRVARSNPDRSVTFGTIPSATELQEALDREGGWSMTLRGSDERVFDAAMRQARIKDAISQMQTGSGMRRVLSALMSYANRKANAEYRRAGKPSNFESSQDVQTAESLASSIVGILGWEWI